MRGCSQQASAGGVILKLYQGDCLKILPTLPDNSVDSIVTDPPYELGFMNRKWDSTGISYNVDVWKECMRVLKPGGYLLAFGGTRTYHRMVCAIEDAGFTIHPMIAWINSQGFPKATNLSKQFDKQAGFRRPPSKTQRPIGGKNGIYEGQGGNWVETQNISLTPEAQQWDGWYYGLQSLKPAIEPICMAQKPISEKRMTDNVLEWGTGAVNIDVCRIEKRTFFSKGIRSGQGHYVGDNWSGGQGEKTVHGRFPANVLFDEPTAGMLDKSGASRFFYVAKASKKERGEFNNHPTVKPLALIRYLVKLVTPPNGIVLDPFAGSGTTGLACQSEGFGCILIEMESHNCGIIKRRLCEGVG